MTDSYLSVMITISTVATERTNYLNVLLLSAFREVLLVLWNIFSYANAVHISINFYAFLWMLNLNNLENREKTPSFHISEHIIWILNVYNICSPPLILLHFSVFNAALSLDISRIWKLIILWCFFSNCKVHKM